MFILTILYLWPFHRCAKQSKYTLLTCAQAQLFLSCRYSLIEISYILKHFVMLIIVVDFCFFPLANVGCLKAAAVHTESTERSVLLLLVSRTYMLVPTRSSRRLCNVFGDHIHKMSRLDILV